MREIGNSGRFNVAMRKLTQRDGFFLESSKPFFIQFKAALQHFQWQNFIITPAHSFAKDSLLAKN